MIWGKGSPIRQIILPNQTSSYGIYCGGVLVWKNDPVVVEVTNSGALAIPAYARFIDFVIIGGGASGQTGNGSNSYPGLGGNAGSWLGFTLERGVEIPWTSNTANITIGNGGAQPANTDYAQPNAGEPTTVSIAGLSPIFTYGGLGARSDSIRFGKDAPNYTYNGRTYIGGAGGTGSTGDDLTGKAPGGGGGGGFGGFFGSRTQGWPGGKGRAWAVFRSF